MTDNLHNLIFISFFHKLNTPEIYIWIINLSNYKKIV
jgi:hypothetical protein